MIHVHQTWTLNLITNIKTNNTNMHYLKCHEKSCHNIYFIILVHFIENVLVQMSATENISDYQ
jgi:pantothenate kinase